MTVLREIGYPPLLMLLAGAIIMGVAVWIIGPTYRLINGMEWVVLILGYLLLLTATVLLFSRLLKMPASWSLAAVAFIISMACGLGGFAWRFPALTDPMVLHPSMLLPLFQLAWFALTFVLIAKTLNWPRRRNRP